MDRSVLDKLLHFVVQNITIDIVAKANNVQQALDNFIGKQALTMPEDQITDLLASGQTSVVQAQVDSFMTRLGQILRQGVNVSFQAGLTQYQTETSADDDEYEWVAKRGARHCPDCASRDGEVETWSVWRDILGLPASGFSVCLSNCRCKLRKVKK